jgi:hypothetical protein
VKAQIVRCSEHGEGNCFQQFSGAHISAADCSCETKPPYQCPIDAHATKYLLENPEWEEEAPARHALPNKPKPQGCGHRGDKRLVDLPGEIRSWLCKACRREIEERLAEVTRPATPIELYSKRGRGTKMGELTGCTYNLSKNKKVTRLCGLTCDEGKTLCPRHLMLMPIEQAEARRREDARISAAVQRVKEKKGVKTVAAR